MRKNRIILLVLMIVTAVISSMRGGTISYTLFYVVWGAPILSILYLLYVYLRFKIYQDIEKRVLVKGEKVPYNFMLTNQDIITYTSVNVKFFDRLSKVDRVMTEKNYSLTPGQSYKWETSLIANYRGEYSVGIDKVEVMDFLHLFKLTYRFPKTIMLQVLPRIPHYDKLLVAAEEYDTNNNANNARKEEVFPDVELRKYVTGDSIRAVNWKASARGGELFTRKYIDESEPGVLLLCDFSSTGLNGDEKVIIEDKVIEASLGIADYLYRRNVVVNTLFSNQGKKVLPIYSKSGMNKFYDECAKTVFMAEHDCAQLLLDNAGGGYAQVIIVTHALSEKLIRVAEELLSKGSQIEIIYVGDDNLKDKMWDANSGIRITRILSEQEVGDVLNRKV